MAESTEYKTSAYNKRPLWQWILFYVLIGGALYLLVYYLFFAKKGGNVYNSMPSQSATVQPTPSAVSSNIIMTKNNPAKGSYLADFQGMTLYVFDKDTTGVSNCYNNCAITWPPYTSGATAQSQMPGNITVIMRTDGSKQFAWKGMPLYYYSGDQKSGDVVGDGVGGLWHLVKL